MVVTTRRSQDVQTKTSQDPPGSLTYSLPGYNLNFHPSPAHGSAQTKANDKQLRYLFAVYDSLAENGQVALASRMTGLCVSPLLDFATDVRTSMQHRAVDPPLDVPREAQPKTRKTPGFYLCLRIYSVYCVGDVFFCLFPAPGSGVSTSSR